MVTIRKEQDGDIVGVRAVNQTAFEQKMEANIVDSIRAACSETVSLVAVENDEIVGHILFSPATISSGTDSIQGMGLAPMAVEPEHQRQGVGSLLIKTGIEAVQENSCPFIIVLGHPEYYPRFGFVLASRHGLSCQWEGVPDEAFMVLILDEAAMEGVSGIARYRDEFEDSI